jgi:uncharacterized membrane protein
MTVLRQLRKIVLGETWLLPLGVAAVVLAAALVVRPLLGDAWDHAGGFVLLAGVVVVLVGSVAVTARPRR